MRTAQQASGATRHCRPVFMVLVALMAGADTPAPSPATTTRPAPSAATRPDGTGSIRPDGGPLTAAAAVHIPPSALPDPKQIGGEAQSIVQVANLIYAGSKSSRCFSDYFLVQAEKASAISTSRRFHSVKLDSEELFGFPLVIMTGE
mgnify:CR=1 FL=1